MFANFPPRGVLLKFTKVLGFGEHQIDVKISYRQDTAKEEGCDKYIITVTKTYLQNPSVKLNLITPMIITKTKEECNYVWRHKWEESSINTFKPVDRLIERVKSYLKEQQEYKEMI